MRHLILLRHAKSSWSNPGLADVDRPLSKRGERDAPRMGERLKVRKARPSLIITSHAKRARRTAELVARALGYPQEFLQVEPSLYGAGPAAVLAVVTRQPEKASSVLLVAHNPTLTELANDLLPSLQLDNLPTAGVVAVDFETDRWDAIGDAPTRLAYLDYPKNPQALIIED